ncbi:MAG TPA: hypothetical protein ENK18_14050, partial [Deltaproteobacteria bacterium]|nr:hypothetical protein [Deltaproteobacteria bacterium]
MAHADRPRWWWWGLTALIVAWLAVLAVSAVWGVPHIERALKVRSEAALGEISADQVEVSVSQRDVTLAGVLPPGITPSSARDTVAALWGVRTVQLEQLEAA